MISTSYKPGLPGNRDRLISSPLVDYRSHDKQKGNAPNTTLTANKSMRRQQASVGTIFELEGDARKLAGSNGSNRIRSYPKKS